MFTITITETRLVKKVCGKEWKTIGQERVQASPDSFIAEKYGYTPEIEKVVEETVEVLKQNVPTLDLAKVVKAINNM